MKDFYPSFNCGNIYLATCNIFVLHAFLVTAITITTGTVSIENTSGYLGQRECVQSVLWSGRIPSGESNVVDWLGCTNHLDSCFCRPDLASSASSLLTSAINSFCSNDTADVAGGVSVYNSYCSRTVDGGAVTTSPGDTSATGLGMATVTATQTVTSSTASGNTLPSPQTPSSTQNSGTSFLRPSSPTPTTQPTPTTPTASPTSGTSSSGSGNLSIDNKIALGVGLGVGLPTVLIACWEAARKIRRKKRTSRA